MILQITFVGNRNFQASVESESMQRYNNVATMVSMSISTLSVLIFAITRESYAVAVVFLLLVMKGILLLKCAKV